MAAAETRPRRSRREERKQETRAELVQAAGRAFAERGFHGASIEQIAAEAGYSTGAVYWHFKNKDELFLAVFEDFASARIAELDEVRRSAGGSLGTRARAYADQWMERQAADPAFAVIVLEFLAYAARRPELRQAIALQRTAVPAALAEILAEDSQREGIALPLAAPLLARALRELGVGLALARIADPDGVPDSLFGDFVQSYFDLLEAAAAKPAGGAPGG
jgi:AcrR family transcriptional regulator